MKPTNIESFAWESLLDRQRDLWREGETPSIASLVGETPWSDNAEARLDLIYNEFVVRESLGQRVDAADYLARFPEFADDLRLQFEVHAAVGEAASDGDHALLDTEGKHADLSQPENDREDSPVAPPGFEIWEELGRGGSAVVRRARHLGLRRDVALKFFRAAPTQRERLRFQAEAAAVARLTHPNIIQIYEIGEADGRPFLALEFAPGGNLAQKLQQFPLTARGAAELIRTLALAVQHAHERDVIHRDLKPANVLFTREGTPKLADFGLAKLRDDEACDVTQTGETLGTPRYMAPEQTSGAPSAVGPPADVYALGTLLYECLTGRAPFVAATVMETVQKIRLEEPLSPRKLLPNVPRDLETICLHCLRKEPSRRYASAAELAADLGRWLNGEPIVARPVSQAERIWKWCRRRPTEAALIASALLATVAAAGGFAEMSRQERERLHQLRTEVARLMNEGRGALEQEDFLTAESRLTEAWQILQAEPDLADHTPGVSGWLDHVRRGSDKQLWKSRLAPREYDERRDDAIVESVLPAGDSPADIARAAETLRSAFEFTLPNDSAWSRERELLTLLQADLKELSGGAAEANTLLDAAEPFASRLYFTRRAALYERLQRAAEAAAAGERAAEFPPDPVRESLLRAVDCLQARDAQEALVALDGIIAREPAHFTARLLQGVCFLHLGRPAEARVALTACIAQRPNCPWGYYYRSRANAALGQDDRTDLASAAGLKPSPALQSLLTRAAAKDAEE